MQNTEGKKVDLYIPRKCSATHRLITPKDHASVQISIAQIDPITGCYTGENTQFALCGSVRVRGEADALLNALATDAGFLQNVVHGVTSEL